jgi:hypothetical protein
LLLQAYGGVPSAADEKLRAFAIRRRLTVAEWMPKSRAAPAAAFLPDATMSMISPR